MCEISEQLMLEQSDEIFLECLKSAGKVFHGHSYLWSMMKKSSVSRIAKAYVFSHSVLCLGKMNQNPISNTFLGTTVGMVQRFITIQNTGHNRRRTDGIRVEYFPRIHYIAARPRSPKVHEQNGRTRTIPRANYLRVDVQMTSCGEIRTMKRNVLLIPHLCLDSQKDFQQDVGHSSDPGQKQSGTPLTKKDREENGIESLNWWWSNSESGHPVFQATSPLSRGTLKSNVGGKLSIHFCADGVTIVTVFRTVISVNQLSIYGAFSDLCEEYSICQTSTGRLVVAEQSDPFFAPADLLMMTPTSSIEILAQENLSQQHKERVENLPQPDQLKNFCTDARFLKTVEVGQCFMTKHTDEFLQFAEPVTCREYTLPRDEKSTDPKGWIQGNTKVGPVLEVTTSYLQGKHGVEIRIERQFSLVDQNFSWPEQIGHRLDRQEVRRQRAGEQRSPQQLHQELHSHRHRNAIRPQVVTSVLFHAFGHSLASLLLPLFFLSRAAYFNIHHIAQFALARHRQISELPSSESSRGKNGPRCRQLPHPRYLWTWCARNLQSNSAEHISGGGAEVPDGRRWAVRRSVLVAVPALSARIQLQSLWKKTATCPQEDLVAERRVLVIRIHNHPTPCACMVFSVSTLLSTNCKTHLHVVQVPEKHAWTSVAIHSPHMLTHWTVDGTRAWENVSCRTMFACYTNSFDMFVCVCTLQQWRHQVGAISPPPKTVLSVGRYWLPSCANIFLLAGTRWRRSTISTRGRCDQGACRTRIAGKRRRQNCRRGAWAGRQAETGRGWLPYDAKSRNAWGVEWRSHLPVRSSLSDWLRWYRVDMCPRALAKGGVDRSHQHPLHSFTFSAVHLCTRNRPWYCGDDDLIAWLKKRAVSQVLVHDACANAAQQDQMTCAPQRSPNPSPLLKLWLRWMISIHMCICL